VTANDPGMSPTSASLRATPAERRARPATNDEPSGERARGGLRRVLREPLVHFIALGAVLFAAYAALDGGSTPAPTSNQIELTVGDLRQLEIAFASQWQRPPTADEMVGLVESRVREEILYREALALGLDKDDTIVKRRMAQKMEFLAEDVADAREPTPGELEAWFDQHTDQFAEPARVTFRHLYFSPDRRGAGAHDDAVRALEKLGGTPEDSPATKPLGDPFMFPDYLADRSSEQVAKDFGPSFARALFALPPGSWQGPIESGYGWHLIFLETSTPGRVPAFEEVEPEVRTSWNAEQHAQAWSRAYEKMRAKYQLVLPAPPAGTDGVGAPQPGNEP
jgi:peptidyl-prolyl cis-trans isomerase C